MTNPTTINEPTAALPLLHSTVDILDYESGAPVRSGHVVGYGTMLRSGWYDEELDRMIPTSMVPMVLVELTVGIASPENSPRPDLWITTLVVHPSNVVAR